jgi:NFU1 iron-sulfur cluster scaffold homolog, mitochondrial
MSSDLKITAHVDPAQPDVCRFNVDATINPYGSIEFTERTAAEGSPLAERLYAIAGVTHMLIAGNTVVVGAEGSGDWRALGTQIGQAIRAHVASGDAAIAERLQPPKLSDDEMKVTLRELFDTQVNPSLASHGGNITLNDVKDGKVYIQLGGGCQGCASSQATLRLGVEKMIRQQLPQVTEILDNTDHAAGTNPYYTAQ